jgi:hypothetical protein
MHTESDKFGELSIIALRFISLATSETDVERTLNLQQMVQGLHGTNCGSTMIGIRLLLHKASDTFRLHRPEQTGSSDPPEGESSEEGERHARVIEHISDDDTDGGPVDNDS